jgi:hypothetical protein
MNMSVIVSSGFPKIVNSEDLDELLQKNIILAFHRSDGWVRVGFDEIREPSGRKGTSWKDRKTLLRQRKLMRITNT